MEEQSEQTEVGLVGVIKNLVQTLLHFLGDLTSLASLEARLAGKSLLSLVLLTFVLGAFFISAWLCFLALLTVFFVSVLQYSWLVSLSLVLLSNLLMILVVGFVMAKLKDNLLFRATRRQLGLLREEPAHEQSATEN